jgi:D-glycero-alpha-D-manno-heptose 1-phosphate guanylyltransferase
LQAVILAGGLGTRLREVVRDRPKPLAELDGKPFLEYQIDFLKKYCITDLIICVGYLSEKIENHFLDGTDYGVSIAYSREEELLGTGGALKNAMDLLHEQFFVLNGDTLFLINLFEMEKFHEYELADATLALTKVNDPSRYGSVIIDHNDRGNHILSFSENSTSRTLINAGIYIMNKELFCHSDLPDRFSFENYFLPKIIQTSRVCGFVDECAYFVDIGTATGYRRLEEDIKLQRIAALK